VSEGCPAGGAGRPGRTLQNRYTRITESGPAARADAPDPQPVARVAPAYHRGYPVRRCDRASLPSATGAPMTVDDFKHQLPDIDEAETSDWVDSFD
jgi:hypothetical protein